MYLVSKGGLLYGPILQCAPTFEQPINTMAITSNLMCAVTDFTVFSSTPYVEK